MLNTQNNTVDFGTVPKRVPTFKFKKPVDDIDKAIQAFLTGKVGKFGNYVAVKNALVYRTIITSRNGTLQELGQNIIALKIDRPNETLYIGNSSILPLVGRSVSFGRESLNRGVSDVQTRLSAFIQMIPFSVFIEAGLNLNDIKILDRGSEETVVRTETRYDSKTQKDVNFDAEVHFTGASLFQVGTKLFLFDIDRRELGHKIFNAFLVELQVPASTIRDAYETLKPQDVKDAEAKGLKVLRQGEWFFIPVQGEFDPEMRRAQWGDNKGKMEHMPLELRAGQNRPNRVTKHAKQGEDTFVTGKVEHTGREHAALTLKGWFRAVPNTSVRSFTLVGDVD